MRLRQARDAPQIMNGHIQSLGLLDNQFQLPRHVRRPAFFPFLKEPGQTGYRMKRGSQIMSQGCCQVSQCRKLLHLINLLLQLHNVIRRLLHAFLQVAVKLPVSGKYMFDLIGHVVEVIRKLPQLIFPANGNPFRIASGVKFIYGFDNDLERPADKPSIAERHYQQNNKQQAATA